MIHDERRYDATFDLYSPRWGHTDRYHVRMVPNELSVSLHQAAICRLNDNGDPEWEGHIEGTENPLMNIFHNDQIFAPSIIPEALEWALQDWTEGVVTKEELHEGLVELFSWIDSTSRGKPNGPFWQGKF